MRICLSPSEANAVDSKAASIGLSTTEMGREAVIDASEREIDAPTLLADILGEVAKLKKGETFTARSMAVKCHPKRNNWAYTMTASGPRPSTASGAGVRRVSWTSTIEPQTSEAPTGPGGPIPSKLTAGPARRFRRVGSGNGRQTNGFALFSTTGVRF